MTRAHNARAPNAYNVVNLESCPTLEGMAPESALLSRSLPHGLITKINQNSAACAAHVQVRQCGEITNARGDGARERVVVEQTAAHNT